MTKLLNMKSQNIKNDIENDLKVRGYQLQIQLLQKQIVNKNAKILQIATNRKEMLKQQISFCFQSLEQYLKLISEKDQDETVVQYIQKYIQFTNSLKFKKSWFVTQKFFSNMAVQTQFQQTSQEQYQKQSQLIQKQKEIIIFQATNFNEQKNDLRQKSENEYKMNQKICFEKNQLKQSQNRLFQRQQYNSQTSIIQKNQMSHIQLNQRVLKLQNQELKQLLRKAWKQINFLNSKINSDSYQNLEIQKQNNNLDILKNQKDQNQFKVHRPKYSEGNINFQTHRNQIKQTSKNSQLLSLDIYNLSETPLLSNNKNCRDIQKYIRKQLFNKKEDVSELYMMIMCQASSLQKMLQRLN